VPIITISRGSMSGGQKLAERVAEELHVPCLGREVVVEAAAALGVSREFLSERLEKTPGFWERLTAQRHTYVLAVQAALAEHAAKGALIYHGQAGHMLLKGLPGVLRVRLIAPLEMRASVVMQTRGLGRAAAEAYVRQIDEERARWTRFMYDADLRDSSLYDLIINLETTTIETATAIVVHTARRPEFTPTDEVIAKIMAFANDCRQKVEKSRGPVMEISGPVPIRVLVVDDEKDFAEALAERLSRRGYVAQAVFSGTDAVDCARSRSFDVVTLDLKMPPPDGLTTLRTLQSLDPALQVLVLSGHSTIAGGIEGMQIGALDFLLKPVDIDRLCLSIDAAAEVTREKRSAIARPPPSA
jgi:ActR/RegA family two-component response regulator/cytidylate kinase